jgi:DNA-directed RNA polymerase subunit RPC12/RpoP
LGLLLVAYALEALNRPTIAAELVPRLQWKNKVVFGVGGLAYLLIFPAYFLRERRAGSVIEQTGTLCWRCAHELKDEADPDRCPRCGYTPQLQCRSRLVVAVERFLRKYVVPVAFLAAVAGPIVYSARWHREARPVVEQLRSHGAISFVSWRDFQSGWSGLYAMYFGYRELRQVTGDSAVFAVESDRAFVLILVLPYDIPPKQPVVAEIQITLASMQDDRAFKGAYCPLDRSQLDQVLKSGVPEDLVEELVLRARVSMHASSPAKVSAGTYFDQS